MILTSIIAYIEVLLPLFRDADWLSRCAYLVSDIAYFDSYVEGLM